MSNSSVEHRNHLIALASLPRMGPRRFAALLGHPADPVHAWELVLAGRAHTIPRVAAVLARDAATVAGSWATAARTIDPALLGEHHRERGIEVAVRGDAGYPTALHDDPEPPALLFSRGDPRSRQG